MLQITWPLGCSVRWKSSSMLMAAITVSSSGAECDLMRRDSASAGLNSVVRRYFISKSYPSKVIAQRCNQLAEYTGIPFLESKIESGGWCKMVPKYHLVKLFYCEHQSQCFLLYLAVIAFWGVKDLAACMIAFSDLSGKMCEITAPTP